MTTERKGRGDAHIMHTERTDRFRYEQDIDGFENALNMARDRSLTTNKMIYVMRNAKGSYIIHSHGVEVVGQTQVAVFHRGNKIK